MVLDNFRTIELIWDKANKSIIKTIKTASSDTTGRYLSVKVLDGGQEVTLSGSKLQLYWEHPNFNTSGTDDFNTVNNGGLFKMTFSDEMLTNIGELNAHLVLTLPDGKITSDGFTIKVIKGADSGVVVPTNGSGLVEQINEKIDKGNVTLSDLTQEVKLAMTGGSVAVVGENAVGTENIKSGSVTPEKLDGTVEFVGDNLFNHKKATIGSFVGNNTGSIVTGNDFYCLSDYIPVLPNTEYVKTGTLFTAYYKTPGVLSTEVAAVSGSYLTTPSDTNYIRTSFETGKLESSMVVRGTSYPSTYIPFEAIYEFDPEVYRVNPTNVDTKRTRNLFDPSKVTFGGYYDASGNFVSVPSYGLSDYIEVNEGEVLSKLTTGYSSWYDENKQRIGAWHTTRQARVPKGVKYIRAIVSQFNLNNEMVVRGYEYPTEYIPFEKTVFDDTVDVIDSDELREMTSNLYGKKWAFLGDSLSDYLFSYPHLIAPKYNMTLSNMALSGRSMARRGEPTDTNYPPLIDIYQDVPTDVDVITIWVGTNDKGSNVPIGDIDSVDETTFMGAYNVMMKWLIENRPTAKVLLITPMQRSDSTGQTGVPLIDYVNAVEEIGVKYSKRVLNMYKNSGIYVYSEVVKQNFIPDGLHPGYEGHKRFIAPVIESEMLRI